MERIKDAAAWLLSRIAEGWRWLWRRALDWASTLSASAWRALAAGVLVLILLYYGLGMMLLHRVDDDLSFGQSLQVEPGASHAVAVVAGLIDREVNQHGWVMNDPPVKPSALLDNMPNFQQGMFGAFARFALEMRDQIGRTRGSSSEDSDLDTAAGLLPYPGDVWIFNFDVSVLPTASAEKQYRRARQALISYNRRLAQGDAVFERRADNLLATLDRIALDVGASSAALETYVADNADSFWDFGCDDLFYSIKGQAYGYAMILEALRDDFSGVIEGRELGPAFDQTLASFQQVAALDPLVVTNNDVDGLFLPNHLVAQGFYLLRARTQLREITNILLK